MNNSLKNRTASYVLCMVGLSACSGESDTAADLASNLATAEGMIDAFYSFDSSSLRPFLSETSDAGTGILSYQAWAEGGNYIVMSRAPCVSESVTTISCSITVQDDPVVALETGFNVTDTFHLTFEEAVIQGVETRSTHLLRGARMGRGQPTRGHRRALQAHRRRS